MENSGLTIRMSITRANMIKAMAGLKSALKAATQAIIRFGEVYYSLAEKHYIAEIGPLPGSIRTSRLRKKRKRKVLNFFIKYLNKEGGKKRCW